MNSLLPFFKSRFWIVLFFVFCSAIVKAQTIKGNVSDVKNGETLIGATVQIEQGSTKLTSVVKLDGMYTFKNVAPGTYKLHVNYVGYKTTKEYVVEVTNNNVAVLNIKMVDDLTTLNEVTVSGSSSKETDKSARSEEKNADNTLNAVSAQSISISPDVIVSNVLARVSGISVDRNNVGDAEHVIIRGMDKQYNTTLINGIKIPSPDNKNRYVPLNIFPTDLIDRIDVYKTLTPEMEGDASGGVVNLVMKSAPDNLRVNGFFGTGYSQLFLNRGFTSFNTATVNDKAPAELLPTLAFAPISAFPYQNLITQTAHPMPDADASLTIGDRFFNKKLGVLFSGSYNNDYAGSNSFQVIQSQTVGTSPNINTPNQETSFEDGLFRKYSSQLNRIGAMASIDYKINDNNVINLFATYLQLNEFRVRQTEDLVYGGYSYEGYHAPVEVDNDTETRSNLQNIYNITLKGKHQVSKAFSFDWILANSQATHKLPDDAEFKTKYGESPTPGSTTNEPAPGNPGSYTTVATAVTYTPVYVGDESRIWMHNTDKDVSGYLNLHLDTKIFGLRALFSAGGMFRHKTRDNYSDSYSLNHGADPGSITGDELYVSVADSKFQFNNPDDARGTAYSDAGIYTFEENVQGVYSQVKYFISNRFNILFGLRSENTYQYYDSTLPVTFPGKTATITYNDYLPSINAKYSLTDNQAIRASYFTSILRPAFSYLIPYPDPTAESYNTEGNPYLQHTTIQNYDLRYEFFPGVFDEFLGGVFYKYLINPIEQQLGRGPGTGLVLEPVNLGNAHNYGLEFSAKKFFGDLGLAANYTYTNSQITSLKRIDVINQLTPTYLDQTRPLQGQASNLGNLSLLYKNTKNGLDVQLALSYQGESIQAVSEYYGLDTWQKSSVNLDFSAQKAINRRFIIFIKVNNILNTPYELYVKQNNTANYNSISKYPYQESPNHTTVEYDQFYARYNLGLRFKLE